MPTFFMGTLTLPVSVVNQINIYLKNCFWRKFGTQDRGTALIAWEKICRPKTHGGLGVLDITSHNKALLLKFMHKFLNKFDSPWVSIIWETHYSHSIPGDRMVGSFWWKAILKLLPIYKQFAACKPGVGNTIYFWTDGWWNETLSSKFPELHSFAINRDISLQQALSTLETEDLFHRPLSRQAFQQFQALQEHLHQRSPSMEQDCWSLPGKAQSYSSMRMYKHIMGDSTAHSILPHHADSDTKSSFGSCCMIGIIPGACSSAGQCTLTVINVFSALIRLMKHLFISFGTVHLPSVVGIRSFLTEREVYLLLMKFNLPPHSYLRILL